MALHADLIGEQRRIVHLFYHYLIEQYYSTAHLNRRIANLCWSKDPRKKKTVLTKQNVAQVWSKSPTE